MKKFQFCQRAMSALIIGVLIFALSGCSTGNGFPSLIGTWKVTSSQLDNPQVGDTFWFTADRTNFYGDLGSGLSKGEKYSVFNNGPAGYHVISATESKNPPPFYLKGVNDSTIEVYLQNAKGAYVYIFTIERQSKEINNSADVGGSASAGATPEANTSSADSLSTETGGETGNLAASVNGVPIYEKQLDASVAKLKLQNPTSFDANSGISVGLTRSSMLDELINKQLAEQKAKTEGIKVSDAELNQQIDNLKQQYSNQAQFDAAIQQQGYTLSSLKDQLSYQLLLKALAKKLAPANASDAELNQVSQNLLTSLHKNAHITIYDQIVKDYRSKKGSK